MDVHTAAIGCAQLTRLGTLPGHIRDAVAPDRTDHEYPTAAPPMHRLGAMNCAPTIDHRCPAAARANAHPHSAWHAIRAVTAGYTRRLSTEGDSVTMHATASGAGTSGDLLGHPKGLYVCFMTEMWERFSFYGMKALLFLYLTKYHLFNDATATSCWALRRSGLRAAIARWAVADRWLGMRKAVLFGGALLVLGHLGMAWIGIRGHRKAWARQCHARCVRDPGDVRVAGASSRGCGLPQAEHLDDRRPLYADTTRAATRPSRSSTWASTSARRCPR
jgi:hypothetical protein